MVAPPLSYDASLGESRMPLLARNKTFTENHSLVFRSRRALPMTETELMLIAAPAMIGLSSKPKNG